jgi:hypothetical protein
MREEVADALNATPAERIEAMIALLESIYQLWAVRGFDRDEGLCRFPQITQQRRRGLCSDRRNSGTGSRSVSNDACATGNSEKDLPDVLRLDVLRDSRRKD